MKLRAFGLLLFSILAVGQTNQSTTKQLTLNGVATLSVTTASLPSYFINKPYTVTLAAAGGVTPYVWSITQGTLPAGLTLAPSTGIISGTATALCNPNPCVLTVQVTDSSSTVAQIKLDWTPSVTATATTQNVKRSDTAGGPYNVLTSLLPSVKTWIDVVPRISGKQYFYVVTALEGTSESLASNEVSPKIP